MLKSAKVVVDAVGIIFLCFLVVGVMALAGALDSADADLVGFFTTVSLVSFLIVLLSATISHYINQRIEEM